MLLPKQMNLESPEARATLDAFRQGLHERGYVEGQTIVIEYRSTDGKIERFPSLANELASLKLDLILASNTPAASAMLHATTAIPRRARRLSRPARREHHRLDVPRP